MSITFNIQLKLNKNEREKIRERFKCLTELNNEEFTLEEAIDDLFYFEVPSIWNEPLDLRGVKVKKEKRRKNECKTKKQ